MVSLVTVVFFYYIRFGFRTGRIKRFISLRNKRESYIKYIIKKTTLDIISIFLASNAVSPINPIIY